MLNEAKSKLVKNRNKIKYEIINIENIPHENDCFDFIIANHMLYHVQERRKALSEIKRVLKKDGIFYATTMYNDYMKEMRVLIKEFIMKENRSEFYETLPTNNLIKNFSLQNGEEQLKEFFDNVEIKTFRNSLKITEAHPFIDYIYSCNGINQGNIKFDKIDQKSLFEFINNKLKINGEIFIQADSGIFINKNN
jgi:ubiquinone/menaquinone biosynthesis C-methylase UbiE